MAAVQMNHRTGPGMLSLVGVCVRAVQAMINVKPVASRKTVDPAHPQGLVPLSLDSGSRITTAVGPNRGFAEVSMEYLACFRHGDFQPFARRRPQRYRDDKLFDEFSETAAFILLDSLELQQPAALHAPGHYPRSPNHPRFDEFSPANHFDLPSSAQDVVKLPQRACTIIAALQNFTINCSPRANE